MEKQVTPRLRVDNLSIHDVGPVSLDIEKGECVGLSGPSGSGKTLFLKPSPTWNPTAEVSILMVRNRQVDARTCLAAAGGPACRLKVRGGGRYGERPFCAVRCKRI
jgi:ABC-type sugar transport system ATPase subunit